jgi:DinB superfamily
MSSDTGLELLISQTDHIAEETDSTFGHLSSAQLNWKAAAGRWSIAQCFDHLLTTNRSYFPMFEQVLQGQRKASLLERVPMLPSMWGKLAIKSLDPKATRKLKAPKDIQPSSSDLGKQVLQDFVTQQKQIVDYMTGMKDFDLNRIVVTSPILAIMTYSLMDAFKIIVVHERRHLIQAKNVANDDRFPQ